MIVTLGMIFGRFVAQKVTPSALGWFYPQQIDPSLEIDRVPMLHRPGWPEAQLNHFLNCGLVEDAMAARSLRHHAPLFVMSPDPSSEVLDETHPAPLMLAPALSVSAIALFLFYGLTVFNQLLPFQLMLPAWQLSSSAALIQSGLWPLLGLVLLQLAPLFDPGNWRLQDRWVSLGRLGVIAVLGFLLLVPVQLTATGRSLQAMDSAQRTRQQRLEANLNEMRQEIRVASSLADLLQRIRDVQPPDLWIDLITHKAPRPLRSAPGRAYTRRRHWRSPLCQQRSPLGLTRPPGGPTDDHATAL
jgi:hypothetical protein